MNRLYLLIWAIGAALIFRIIMHFVDKNRIKDEVESKGGRVISISWNPLARGWFFEKNERHYDVTYVDRSGTTLSTTCKTSLFTGGLLGGRTSSGRAFAADYCASSLFKMRLCDQRRVARLS